MQHDSELRSEPPHANAEGTATGIKPIHRGSDGLGTVAARVGLLLEGWIATARTTALH
eukprot:SAG11_NODE_319_length_10822_cov_12.319500_8_plen_58_part_00